MRREILFQIEGQKTQESFVAFKFFARKAGTKDPAQRRAGVFRGDLKQESLPLEGKVARPDPTRGARRMRWSSTLSTSTVQAAAFAHGGMPVSERGLRADEGIGPYGQAATVPHHGMPVPDRGLRADEGIGPYGQAATVPHHGMPVPDLFAHFRRGRRPSTARAGKPAFLHYARANTNHDPIPPGCRGRQPLQSCSYRIHVKGTFSQPQGAAGDFCEKRGERIRHRKKDCFMHGNMIK